MSLSRSLFKGGLFVGPVGLFLELFRSLLGNRWLYDSTGPSIGFLMPSTSAPTNYRLRIIASIGSSASGEVSFFGDENPDDLRVSATVGRAWRVDARAGNAESSPGDVVEGRIYLLALIVDNKDWELFVDGNSVISGSMGNAPNNLDLAVGGRNDAGSVDQRIRGQVFAFQYEDVDTPANSKTWKFFKLQSQQPSSNAINDQNELNPLTQVNPPGGNNWSLTNQATPSF